MAWIQVRIDTAATSAASVEDVLMDLGALAVTLEDSADQPIFEPPPGATPLWNATRVTGLFTADQDANALLGQVVSRGCAAEFCRAEILEDKDWEREWMENYHPMQYGDRLWVCPSWKDPPRPEATNLMLDPGLAFGTGTHPTTALCLEWLDGMDLNGKTIIDFGCGSGILGIAGLLLGAKRMIGVDNDPQALISTRANAQQNGIEEDRYTVQLPQEVDASLQGDVVVANILAGPLVRLADQLVAMVKSGGSIALSGILNTQAEEVAACYRNRIALNDPSCRDEWVRLDGQRR